MRLWPSIVGLLTRRSPSAVSGFVIAIVVGIAIDGMTLRPRTHVGKERSERIPPTFTHPDPASAVAVVTFNTRVIATTLHREPNHIFGGSSRANLVTGTSMFCECGNVQILPHAPTTTCVPCRHSDARTRYFFSAGASESPRDTSSGIAVSTNGSEPAEYLACDVFEFGHNGKC